MNLLEQKVTKNKFTIIIKKLKFQIVSKKNLQKILQATLEVILE